MNEAVNGTINQISSSSIEWWSSFICSFRSDLLHYVFDPYELCLETQE